MIITVSKENLENIIREYVNWELENEDYMVLFRTESGFQVVEDLLTFGGVSISRTRPRYAVQGEFSFVTDTGDDEDEDDEEESV